MKIDCDITIGNIEMTKSTLRNLLNRNDIEIKQILQSARTYLGENKNDNTEIITTVIYEDRYEELVKEKLSEKEFKGYKIWWSKKNDCYIACHTDYPSLMAHGNTVEKVLKELLKIQ